MVIEVQRAHIVGLHQDGYSERAISENFKCRKSAVHTAVEKLDNSGTYFGQNAVWVSVTLFLPIVVFPEKAKHSLLKTSLLHGEQ